MSSLARPSPAPPWQRELAAQVSARVRTTTPVAGGDIAESFRVDFTSGERLFVKRYPGAAPGQTQAEARGLRWLAEGDGLRVAQVRALGPDWLALDWIEAGAPDVGRSVEVARRLGEGLAALHRSGAARFGLDTDGWIAHLPQTNTPSDDWGRFYRDQRLRPMIARAAAGGHLDAPLREALAALLEATPLLVGASEAPSRLHGDLWRGNVVIDRDGIPWLIDPAAYAGHREIDLAMMQLFGGFGRDVFDHYAEVFPLSDGAANRVCLYQVYPLLVHVCLFGDGYVGQLAAVVERALSSARTPGRP